MTFRAFWPGGLEVCVIHPETNSAFVVVVEQIPTGTRPRRYIPGGTVRQFQMYIPRVERFPSFATGVEYTFLPAVLDVPWVAEKGVVDPFRHIFVSAITGFWVKASLDARGNICEKGWGSGGHYRGNSRGLGSRCIPFLKLLSPEDQGLRGLGFMGSRFLGLGFLVSGFLGVLGLGVLGFGCLGLGIMGSGV